MANPGDETDVPQARLGWSNGTGHSTRYLEDGILLDYVILLLDTIFRKKLMKIEIKKWEGLLVRI